MIRALAITCLVLLATSITFGVLWHQRGLQLEAAHTAALTSASTIRDMGDTNANQYRTIVTLQGKLQQAAGRQQDVEARAREAQANADTNAAQRDKALADVQALRRQLYASDPDARDWSTGRVPASLSHQLFDEWTQAARGDP